MGVNQTLKRDPTIEVLCEKVGILKKSIAKAILEFDHIRLQINPQIEAEYALKIGCYENELLMSEIAARREKIRWTLLLAAVNSGQEPNMIHIEEKLSHELLV